MFEADFASCVAVVTASAVLSAGLIFLLKPLLARHLLAHPNERSSHATATPEGAGYGVMGALLAVCTALLLFATLPPPSLIPVLAGAAVLTVVGDWTMPMRSPCRGVCWHKRSLPSVSCC